MVTRIGYVALCTPDLDRAVQHARDVLGLSEVERQDGTVYLTCNERHHEHVLIGGDRAALDRLAFEVRDPAALATLRDELSDAGFELLEDVPATAGVGESAWVIGPGGFTFELFCAMELGERPDYDTDGIRPTKFEHITIKTTNKEGMEAFLIDRLGFRMSDRADDQVSWLRASDEHHGVSVIRAGADQLHHYAWQISGWTDIKRIGDHLLERDERFLWGPGHHGIGDNYFCYFLDPDGSIIEYSADILRVTDEAAYEPRTWPDVPQTVNQWGNPEPPQAFVDGGTPIVTRTASASAA